MGAGISKQSASRPTKYQVLNYASATVFTTKFGPSVQHIRVMSQIGGWGTINDTTADSVIATSAGGVGMIITGISTGYPLAVTTVGGSPYPEYFSCVPGQIFTFSSTSTSTGSCTVTEMA